MVSQSTDTRQQGRLARIGHILVHEFYEVLPPTIFFFVGFNLILFTKRLILADHLIEFTGFAIATVGALVVGNWSPTKCPSCDTFTKLRLRSPSSSKRWSTAFLC